MIQTKMAVHQKNMEIFLECFIVVITQASLQAIKVEHQNSQGAVSKLCKNLAKNSKIRQQIMVLPAYCFTNKERGLLHLTQKFKCNWWHLLGGMLIRR